MKDQTNNECDCTSIHLEYFSEVDTHGGSWMIVIAWGSQVYATHWGRGSNALVVLVWVRLKQQETASDCFKECCSKPGLNVGEHSFCSMATIDQTTQIKDPTTLQLDWVPRCLEPMNRFFITPKQDKASN